MRVHYKAAQLALYGSGSNVHIATVGGKNRIVVFDSRAIMVLNWDDHFNKDSKFSICVSRTDMVNLMRRGKPRNGFYELRLNTNGAQAVFLDHAIMIDTIDYEKANLGALSYTEIDPNQFNQYFVGLSVDQSVMTGSVCVDFDRLRYVLEFLHAYIAAGRFGNENIRIVNFQSVNEEYPLVLQAFMKLDDRVTCDLDVAVFSFRK